MRSEADTVLLVDDHRESREGLRFLLEGEGFRVETAADGREALNKLVGGLRPCIVVLDLEMPIMTGYAFRRAQLRDRTLRDIPVVLFSSAPNLDDAARQMRVQAYAEKPSEPEKLLEIILRHCVRDPPARSCGTT